MNYYSMFICENVVINNKLVISTILVLVQQSAELS